MKIACTFSTFSIENCIFCSIINFALKIFPKPIKVWNGISSCWDELYTKISKRNTTFIKYFRVHLNNYFNLHIRLSIHHSVCACRVVVRNFNPRVPHIKGLKILRVPGNCSLDILLKSTGAITWELKFLWVPGTRGTRPKDNPGMRLKTSSNSSA